MDRWVSKLLLLLLLTTAATTTATTTHHVKGSWISNPLHPSATRTL